MVASVAAAEQPTVATVSTVVAAVIPVLSAVSVVGTVGPAATLSTVEVTGYEDRFSGRTSGSRLFGSNLHPHNN